MLKGKNALVTGSTSGIGLGIAEKLANEGINLVINGLGDAKEIEVIRASLASKYGVTVLYDPADMTQPDQIECMMKKAMTQLGGVDILVNNAGIQHVAPVEEFPASKWDAIIAINLSSAFHTTRMAVSYMKSKGWGRIINVASAHALVASPFKSAYVASKHGILGFTKTIALEVATKGVTVNAICPGFIGSEMTDKLNEEQIKAFFSRIPLGRMGKTQEIADAALWLASDLSTYVTGQAITVDGGMTM